MGGEEVGDNGSDGRGRGRARRAGDIPVRLEPERENREGAPSFDGQEVLSESAVGEAGGAPKTSQAVRLQESERRLQSETERRGRAGHVYSGLHGSGIGGVNQDALALAGSINHPIDAPLSARLHPGDHWDQQRAGISVDPGGGVGGGWEIRDDVLRHCHACALLSRRPQGREPSCKSGTLFLWSPGTPVHRRKPNLHRGRRRQQHQDPFPKKKGPEESVTPKCSVH